MIREKTVRLRMVLDRGAAFLGEGLEPKCFLGVLGGAIVKIISGKERRDEQMLEFGLFC